MTHLPDDSDLPLNERLPPPNLASPGQLRPRDPKDVRWYKPGLSETLGLMGWRIIYFLPAVVLVGLLVLAPRQVFWPLVLVGWKLIIPAIVLPSGYALNVARNILRTRPEPFCIHC